MAATQNSQGIQILLEAEKEADRIVQKGRAYRQQRLKDAKTESEKEIEALRASKQRSFLEHEAQFAGSTDQMLLADDASTERLIAATRQAFDERRELVVEKLLGAVADVQPRLHINAQHRQRSA